MKKLFFFLLFFFTGSLLKLSAQTQQNLLNRQQRNDSLRKILAGQKNDTAKVTTLQRLIGTYVYEGAPFDSVRKYYHSALSLSKQLGFSDGIILSHAHIGLAFYNNDKPDSAQYYYRLGLAEASLNNNKKKLSMLYIRLGWITNTSYQNSDSAVYFFNLSYNLAKESNDTALILESSFQLSTAHNRKGNLVTSTRLSIEATRLAEVIKDTAWLIRVYLNQCYLFSSLNLHKEELELARKAFALSLLINNSGSINASYCFLIEAFYRQKQYDSVLHYTNLLLPLSTNGGNPFWISSPYNYFGKYYLNKNEIAKARNYFQLFLEKAPKNTEFEAEAWLGLGHCSFKDKNYKLALQHFLKAKKIAIQTVSPALISEINYQLYKLYDTSGNYKEALAELASYNTIQDSIVIAQNNFAMNYLNLQVETQRKEEEIKLLTKESALQTAVAGNQKQRKNFAYTAMAAILLFTGYGYYRYRQNRKLSKKLASSLEELKLAEEQLVKTEKEKEAENVRLRISRDIHDEVGATLSGVALYCQIVKQKMEQHKEEEVHLYLNHISDNSKEMVEKMGDIVWAINPENDSFDRIISKLHSYAFNLCKGKNIKLHVDIDKSIRDYYPDMQVRKNMYMLIKEAINNAVKYSGGKNLYFSFQKQAESIIAEVKDDGKGFDVNSAQEGNGLNNMKARAAELNAAFNIYSVKGEGTSIKLQFNFHPSGGHLNVV
jgi:signal transduction histidine kinase